VHHAQAAVVDGALYVFGGAVTQALLPGTLAGVGPRGWPITDASFRLAPGAQTWEPIASLPEARGLGGAAVLDGLVYLVGGAGLGGGYLDATLVYDPATDSYSEGPPLPTTRDHLSVVAHEGRIYALVGRSNAGGAWDDIEAVEAWDVANGTWMRLADAPLGRGGQGAGVLADGRIALVGGERAEGEFTVFDAAHAYDPATDAWTELPPLPQPLHGMAAGSWEGTLYLMGGATLDGGIDSGTLALVR
jgi:N-acetylneuraminic acid mutarotase